MKLHSFHELASRIAHLSTRDGRGVQVTFSGTDAYTDGKRINLPTLPSGTILTPYQFSVWLGYILHEGPGHCTHTDMPLYIQAVESHNDPVFSHILNVLEDVRIENADISLYPGDRKHLDLTHHHVDNLIPLEKCLHPGQMGLFYKSAYKYRNLDTGKIQGEAEPEILNALEFLPSCSSTQDCINLAEKITELFKQNGESKGQESNDEGSLPEDSPLARQGGAWGQNREQSNDETKKSSDNGNLPEQQDSCNSSNNRETDTEGNNYTSNEKQDNVPSDNDSPYSNENGRSKEQSKNKSTDGLSSSAREWQELTEIKNLLENLTAQTREDLGTTYFPPYTLSGDRVFVPSETNLPRYLSTRAALAPQITSLKKMFRVYLQSRAKKSWLRGLEDGEGNSSGSSSRSSSSSSSSTPLLLDRERLHLLPTGSTSIFKTLRDRKLTNTAVELMLDLSSSMDENLVRSAAIILSEALSSIPEIKLSIAGFTTSLGRITIKHLSNIGRLDGMNILLFKDYSEPYIKSRARLGAISTHGFTPLGEAYGKALEHILPQTSPRRIIFLVTDGRPEFNQGDPLHSDFPLMVKVHKKCKSLRIETLGLGIGDESTVGYLTPYVDKCVRIENITSLPQTLLRILKEIVQ